MPLRPWRAKECRGAVILLFVASYAWGRRSASPIYPWSLLYFIFGRNGKHLAQRRRPSILHHSFTPPLCSPNREEVVVVVFLPPLASTFPSACFLPFLLTFSPALFSLASFCLLVSTRCPRCSAPFKWPLVPPPVGNIDRFLLLCLVYLFFSKTRKK